ncbi:MAG: hypothetical protein IIZ39_03735 [Blautia sp.]|nr:hypothetical protein [Blautia sp.]
MALVKRKSVSDVMTPSGAIAQAIEEKKEEINTLNASLKEAKARLKELEKDFKDVKAREEEEARENEIMLLAAVIQKSGLSIEEVKEKLSLN